ncbi:Hypothetical protein KNT65_gp170 [Escherichia phage EcS1]|uniref:Uncharacterized protein n=1 Tax=Escherichia phage EcS1 TaxID=2083276 RepID=A0A2Z5ZDF2_9CAUD|nr:Hypothetical protein KNT65_gp170 [Escherichia phage EcS1]BBC78323.1 Hypothetical protein [Escherichia phage EcS1]
MSHNLENVLESKLELERNVYEHYCRTFEAIKTTYSIVFSLKKTVAANVPAYVAANDVINRFNCMKSIGEYKNVLLGKINTDFEIKSETASELLNAMRFIEAVVQDNGFTIQL